MPGSLRRGSGLLIDSTRDDELVRLLVEVDFLLTDEGVLPPNYTWVSSGPVGATG